MLEWKKQLQKKRIYSTAESTNVQQESNHYESIEQMLNHLRRLLCCLIRIVNNQEIPNLTQILQMPQIQAFINVTQRDEFKILSYLYRRLKIILSSFHYEGELQEDINNIFKVVRSSQQPTILQFFGLCCFRVIEQINVVRNSKKKKSIKLKGQKFLTFNKKHQFKSMSQSLCQTIYSNLDLEKIQACCLFMQGLDMNDNIKYVYDRQKNKNKKAKKQINEYLLSYTSCQQRSRKQERQKRYSQRQKQQRERIMNKQNQKQDRKSSLFNMLRSNHNKSTEKQRSSLNLQMKQKRYELKILRSQSLNKNISRSSSIQKQDKRKNSKQRFIKLEPIIGKKKIRLKLIK